MGDWGRAEEYAADIITDLNHFVAGWTDWNICLDQKGGPNHALNFVDSPIIVNANADEFYKQPMFYALGHFSKFIKKDAIRIDTNITGTRDIIATAAVHQGKRTLVMLNQHDSEHRTVITDLESGRQIQMTVAPRSIVTVLWN
ncbi:hypothetical protein OESDEN_11421 [Oesophagostomum dentatum]|uniref:Glucosylceramidase n=1 Tax=Oesophagostomum dentatum TaxID=61180 RepID=A0A0B1SUZ3_OESDE|nr:hypothetical protein OESDEN_11421 [Oesophagostomum dentatum]